MARFPKIQSPCPYKSDLAAVMDGDFCRMCERNVFDLTGWSDGERVAFLAGCQEEVCVSYRLPVRGVIAAMAIASAALPAAAAAQDGVGDVSLMPQMASAAHDVAVAQAASMQDFEIFVGGIKDPANAEYVDVETERTLAALPVVYEDEAARAPEQPARASGTR